MGIVKIAGYWFATLFVLVLLSILLISCVSRDVQVTETYYETEQREESYNATEQYEIKTPLIKNIYNGYMTIGNIDLTGFFFQLKDGESIRYVELVDPTPQGVASRRKGEALRYIMGTDEYLRWVFVEGWFNSSVQDYLQAQKYNLNVRNIRDINKYKSHRLLFRIDKPVKFYLYSVSDCSKVTSPCKVLRSVHDTNAEFSFAEMFSSVDYSIIAIGSWMGSSSYALSIDYVWDDVTVATREVTKYRQIPVQVQKQRVVTRTIQVPFWETIFGNN